MVKEIQLTQGKKTVVDDDDYAWASQYNWHYDNNGYAKRSDYRDGKQVRIYLHREIIKPPQGMFVDHIDCNGLNNCRSNLRIASHQQNNCNTRKHKDNASGYKGVSRDRDKWAARININGKHQFLGLYSTPEQAHEAYCQASQQYHGEFGRTE